MRNVYKNWTSILLLSFLLTATYTSIQAQVSAYAFSESLGTYTAVTGGTQVFTGTTDDAISASLPIGFNFVYNGTTYTTIKVNSNGWASFGTTTSTGTYTPLSSTGTHHPCLAPLGRDLQGGTTGAEVRVETQGIAPNRVFVINWINYRRWGGTQNFNFQIQLTETSNLVRFVYGTMTTATSSSDYDCGITGATNADFNIRTSTTTWSGTTAGATNADNMTISNTIFPASGTTYVWGVPPATPPTPTQSASIPSCATGTDLDLAGPPPADVTWYWQTTASGTSTANPYSGPYTVFANNTYYARALNTVTGFWSAASSSIVVSNIPTATAPPAPVADENPVCVPGTNLTVPAAPGGIEYYWQGTNEFGSSQADPATAPYAVGTTGTYYVASYDASTQCWSDGVGTMVSVNSVTPVAPSAIPSVYDACAGDLSVPIEATVAGGSIESTYTLNMIDSWGDGWNGASVDILLNGIVVATGTLPNGAAGSLNFNVFDGDVLTTEWNSGTFDGECSFNIVDNNAVTIGSGTATTMITYNVPVGTYTINWYDAAAGGTFEGTGSPFETVGTNTMPTTIQGVYEFYAETDLGGCVSNSRTLVTVNIVDVNVTLTSIDETCIGNNDGSFTIGSISCGTIPFEYSIDGGVFGPIPTDLSPGSYEVVVQDANTNQSSPITVVIGTTDTSIPVAPTADPDFFNACTGDASIPIEATVLGGSIESTYTLNMIDSWGDGWNGASLDILLNGVIVATGTMADGSNASLNFNVFDGDVLTTEWNSGTFDGECSFNIVDNNAVTIGSGNATTMITYNVPVGTYTINWYDAAVAGTFEGTGSPFESVGTTTLPVATEGVYEFYAEAALGNCISTSRTLVTVNVNNVNVTIDPIDADCNNAPTGSFILGAVACGAAPFLYSVDGGAFGAIPTDLMAGTYSVVVQDVNMDESVPYTIVIDEAGAPSDAYMEDITDNGGQVSWNSNGSETEWNVEWGLPGFTPGTGSEIGSDIVTDTFAIITGLDGNMNYDVYVSANCGAATTAGGWDMVNWTTDCGIYSIPFVETFEDDSESRVCWQNIQEIGTANWTYQTGSSGGAVNTAFEGVLNARFVDVFGTNSPITKLESPRFDLTGQDSVAIVFAYAQESAFGDQNTTKVYTFGPAATWTEVASYTTNVNAWTVDTIFVSDTTEKIAFEGINNSGRANVIDYVQVLPCNLNPGVDGTADVCRLDGTFDLTSIVTLGEDFGTWSFPSNPGVLNGGVVNVSTLPSGDYDFYYIVKTPCAEDTTIATLTIYPPSTAGNDGVITACMNEPINLLSGLSGTVDLGGQWYDPMNNPISVSITASNLPGNFNYDYITSNGVCPNDTSNIVLTVLSTCDYLDIQELVFGDMNVYPNPTDGLVFVSSTGNAEVFNYELTDVNGRVISAKTAAINGTETTEISLEQFEPGIYMIRVYNASAEKTFRVVKQ